MSDEVKNSTENFFVWVTRLSIALLTIMGAQMYNDFNEVKQDVKQLLKEHEVVKTKVEIIDRQLDILKSEK